MASVFEFFGIKKQSEYTAIPRLSIKSPLSALQLKSERYFTISPVAEARDGNKLGVSVQGQQNFNLASVEHLDFLTRCVDQFNEKSIRLKAIDRNIAGSIILSIAASSLSFLPLLGSFLLPLSWIGWGAAIYFMNQRGSAFTEYQESLTLLVAACNWSLGEKPTDPRAVTQNPVIRSMMTVLYPVLTETQVKHLIADQIENVFIDELKEFKGQFAQGTHVFSNERHNIALSKKGAEFNRCIYGFNKGSFVDFLDALASVIPDLFRVVQYGWQQGTSWCQEKISGLQHSA